MITATVAGTMNTPWILSWGAEVEVVGPEAEAKLAEAARQMGRSTYQTPLAASRQPLLDIGRDT